MSTKKSEENKNNIHLLQKKRENSKKSKKGHKRHLKTKKHKDSLSLSYKRKRDMKLTKQNIRHFFHINWDDTIYDKESSKIGLYINGLVYWFLINSSYFVEENIPDYITKLKEEINSSDILPNNNINNISNITKIANNNEIMTSLISDTYNNSDNFMKNTTYESHCRENNSINEIEYEYDYQTNNSNALKEKITKHLSQIHQINENHIHELEKKAQIIKKEYDNNNTIIDNSFKCVNENPIYTKNELSFSILNKYLIYLFGKEKNDLLLKEKAETNEKECKLVSETSSNQNEDQEEDSEDICFVCNNCDFNQSLFLYECEQCGIKVHQFCYGINFTKPQKHWKCDKCKEMSIDEGNNLECILCPNKGGAMKKINIPKDSSFYIYLMNCRNKKDFANMNNNNNYNIIIPKNKFKEIDCAWVHLSCAIWNNKFINIGNYDSKKNININNYEKFNNLCNICNKDNFGPIVKCNNNNCDFQCHPECARLKNYYLEVEYVEIKKMYKYNIYCYNHHPNKYAKIINNITKYSNEEIYEFEDALNKVFKIHNNYCKYQKSNDKIDLSEHEVIEIPISIKENNKIEKTIKSKIKKNKASICKIFIKKKRSKIGKNNKYSLNNSYKSHNNNRIIINDNILFNKENKNKFIINLDEIEDSSENDIKSDFLENEKNPVILINNSPFDKIEKEIKSNNINEQRISLSQEIEQNKDSFIEYLIKYLYNYYENNRIVLYKGNGDYFLSDDDNEQQNFIYYMEYEDLFSSNIPLSDMHYKDLSRESILKYLENIFPNEEAFNNLFINKIDSVLSESFIEEFNKNKKKDFT